jgi:hypothetical protein
MMKTICAAATFMLVSTLSLADSPPFETYLSVPDGFEFKGTVWKKRIESRLGWSVSDALKNTTWYNIPLPGPGACDKTYAFINVHDSVVVAADVAKALLGRLVDEKRGCLQWGEATLKKMWCAVSITRAWNMMAFEIANWGPEGEVRFGEVGRVVKGN